MSTNGMTTWAVDLKDVGAIYPFQGSEVLLTVLLLVFWVGWHILQLRNEGREIRHEMDADPRGEEARKAIDRY
jgi:hypothetical protein